MNRRVLGIAVLAVLACKSQDQPGVGSASAKTAGSALASVGSDAGSTQPDPWAQPAKVRIDAGAGSGTPNIAQPPSHSVAMSPEQAKTAIADAMKLAAEAKPDCDKIANALSVALPIVAPKGDAESTPAYRTLQKCALETKRWRAAVLAGVALLGQKPDTFALAQIVRALAEMGHYDKALAAAKELTARFPAAANALRSAEVFVYCRAEAWEKCEQGSDAALAELAKANTDPRNRDVVVAHVLRDLAWIVRGKPQAAVDDVLALEKLGNLPDRTTSSFDTIKREGAKAVERGFYLEVVPVAQLATGVYHLMGRKDTGALVTVKLAEHTGTARHFRVEAEVPGVTERSSNTLELAPHASTMKLLNPPLKMDFDPAKVRSARPSQLAFKLVEVTADKEKVIVDETIPIQVLPRDYLPLARKTGADSTAPTYGYLGAWVTPNERVVDDFLAKAKLRLDRHAFAGEQEATIPQIKAIFDELKARGVTYVMDPEVTSTSAFVQRTRLPSDVLATTNAQCLEGSLTFATLMESIGVKPIIVIVPGHAFVGWHTVDRDGAKGEPLFVETTMVGSHDFEQAMRVATRRFQQEMTAGTFKTGAATLVDIAEIRKAGFSAQPL